MYRNHRDVFQNHAEVVDVALSVCVQAVAMRWCLDQGVTPVVPVAWGGAGAAFGKRGLGEAGKPDCKLFMRDTFLDADDTSRLAAALA